MRTLLISAGLSLVAAVGLAAPAASGDVAAGAQLYAAQCAACHGPDRAGLGDSFPALTDVGKRLDTQQLREKIVQGGGLMPPFSHLSEKDVDDLAAFLQQ